MYYDQINIIDKEDTAYGIVISAIVKPKDVYYCPYCQSVKLKKHAIKDIKLRDTPIGLKPVILQIKRIRFQCITCKKTFFEHLTFIDEKRNATYGCVKSILHSSFKMSFVQVARIHGVDEKTVRNIFNEYIEITKDKIYRVLPEVMGIDEVYLGSEYRCTITNLQDNLLFDFLESRKKDSLNKFCETYKDQLPNVRIVCMDLWLPYKNMIKNNMPNAIIVADRFHVQRMAINALEVARKLVRKSLSHKERLELKDDRKLLLMNFERLDVKSMERLYSILERFPLLNNIWRAKEKFNVLWGMDTVNEAKIVYKEFIFSLDHEAKHYYKDLLTAMTNWEEEIFNYFKFNRITNAATETLNREIGRKYDVGYGYSFNSLRNKLLFSPQGLDYTNGYSVRDVNKMINKGVKLDIANNILNDILRYDSTRNSEYIHINNLD
jgi:transposase